MSGSAAASDWVCERCTWRNGVSDLTCGMCYGVRASSRDVPVVWQWLAGEEWIPYDQHSIQQIEDAYQRGRRTPHTEHRHTEAHSPHSGAQQPLPHRQRPTAATTEVPLTPLVSRRFGVALCGAVLCCAVQVRVVWCCNSATSQSTVGTPSPSAPLGRRRPPPPHLLFPQLRLHCPTTIRPTTAVE